MKKRSAVLSAAVVYCLCVVAWTRYRIAQSAGQSRITHTALGPIEWAEEGSGPPVLVLHGTPGGYDAGLVAAQSLGAGFRLVSVSRPGYLRTPAPALPSIEAQLNFQADLFAALLDRFSIGAVGVFAYSGGGPYALAFAIRHPEKCRAVLLASAETRPDPETPATHFLRRAGEEFLVWSDLINWLPALFHPIARSLTPVFPRRHGLTLDGDIFAAFPDLAFDRIRCPVLLVHGTRDSIVPFDDAKAAAFLIPHAELLPLNGGHFTPLLTGTPANRKMVEFLRTALLH